MRLLAKWFEEGNIICSFPSEGIVDLVFLDSLRSSFSYIPVDYFYFFGGIRTASAGCTFFLFTSRCSIAVGVDVYVFSYLSSA